MGQLTSGTVSLAVFRDMISRYNAYVTKYSKKPSKISTASGGSNYVTLAYYGVMAYNYVQYQKVYGKRPTAVEITLTKKSYGSDDDSSSSDTALVSLSYTAARQSTGYTCGPTSLKMALSHYGITMAEMTLASYAGTTSSNGTEHSGLIAAVKKVNSLKGTSLTLSETSLTSLTWQGVHDHISAGHPVIAHVNSFLNPGVSGHYVMIYAIDIDNGYVKLGDPSYGVRKVTLANMKTRMDWVISTGRSTKPLMPLTD